MKALRLGLVLTAIVSAVLASAFGRGVLVAALLFGVLATAIQVAASALLRRAAGQPFERLLKAWGLGMGLRLLGVTLFLLAVVADRALFPPLPTALAFVGVLIPLMFSDLRTIR